MKTRLLFVLAAAALAAAATGIALVPPAPADPIDDAVTAFKEYMKTNPDAQGIKNQIGDLATKKDPRVAEVLMPLLKNPKLDDEVKAEVCKAAGQQGKKEVAGQLLFWAEHKSWEEKPKLIAAALEGVGYADAKTNYKELIKYGKKYLGSNAEIAGAAYKAASLRVERGTVDDLIQALTTTEGSLDAKAASKRGPYDAVKPILIEALKKITGKDIGDAKIWTKWWGENKDKWEPPTAGGGKAVDINASPTFTDADYGFSITKPNKAWSFKKGESQGPHLMLEANEEGQRAAWVEMFVVVTKNQRDKTPEAWAKVIRENLEGKFRDFKEKEWEKKCVYGGEKGVEQILFGAHKDFDAIKMHNVFVEKDGIVYYFITVFKSGKKASFETDIDDILKSFKLTK